MRDDPGRVVVELALVSVFFALLAGLGISASCGPKPPARISPEVSALQALVASLETDLERQAGQLRAAEADLDACKAK